MPTIRQLGQQDGSFFRDAEREVSGVFEEPVTVRFWLSVGAGNPALGVAGADVYRNVATRANISELTAEEIFFPGSVYQAGDVRAELRLQVKGAEAAAGDGQTSARKSDLVVWRGRTYYLVGHVNRLQHSGRPYYVGVLRPVGT